MIIVIIDSMMIINDYVDYRMIKMAGSDREIQGYTANSVSY